MVAKPKYPEKITDLPQFADKSNQIRLCRLYLGICISRNFEVERIIKLNYMD